MIRFQVVIDKDTFEALWSLSQQEYREWRLQAGLLIREALQARGYLINQTQDQSDEPQKKQGEE